MKRLIIACLSVLAIAATITPAAHALNAGTSTCPTGTSQCTGSGGGAN